MYAHSKYGKLNWTRLVEPSIKLASDGFIVSRTMESRLKFDEQYITNSSSFGRVFAPNGKLLKEGETVKRPNFAVTLQKIATNPEDFYTGDIARHLIETIQQNGGIMTMKDLRNYQPRIRQPLIGYYHGRKIITTDAPTRYTLNVNLTQTF